MNSRSPVLFVALALTCGLALPSGAATVAEESTLKKNDDPYLWLEDVHGEKSLEWVRAQNLRVRTALEADPEYAQDYQSILKVLDASDRIPFATLQREFALNFWQDAEHPKGLWRRTSIGDYADPAPHWEVLLDLDKLAAEEHENWVWEGAECSPLMKRCLVSLSRGGGDAAVVREFDLATRSFPKDGFALAEAKSSITYLDEDTVLFGTDFGAGSMTESGYPRIVKVWKRGQPQGTARILAEGLAADVSVQAAVFDDPQGTIAVVQRALTFFTSEFQILKGDGTLARLDVPPGADLKGAQGRALIFTLREDWTPAGGARIAKGSLIAYPVDAVPARVAVLFTPDEHTSIDEVECGRDAVFASIYHDVTGSVHAFRSQP